MWNSLQPVRDTQNLNPRTHITHPESIYDVYNPKNMMAQVKLYNWSLSLDYVNGAPINDLHLFLFGKDSAVTKRQMGMTILQAVSYDPRRLKGRTLDNDHAQKMYVFKDPRDLTYGLEWMLSMWIWNMEWSQDDLMRMDEPDRMEITHQIFDELGSCGEEELVDNFVKPIWEGAFYDIIPNITRVDWPTLWAKHGWENEPKPVPTERSFKLKGFV